MSFSEQFDQHGAWRRDFALRLKATVEWLQEQDLLDSAVRERLQRLELQVRSDKVMVAFVAEFSRGKSELINAIFFASYGRRLMPASAGRTTMCPTELGYDAQWPASLRLLPIETRLKPQALAEWRLTGEAWTHIDLDVNDPAQLATAFEKVAEITRVSKDEARALGFWHDDVTIDNPLQAADGTIEVPRWRHALINIPHPLLKQGLVILDTPGLNAIGAEPELTVNLIPQAHAVVFILAADAGVTRSDLEIWREHLVAEGASVEGRVVVLNKIDTLWDSISKPEQIEAQIERQKATTAEILGVPPERVIPVSAQKGLIGKITANEAMLRSSRIASLERVLGEGVVGQRRSLLRRAVATGVAELRAEASRTLRVRRGDLDDQLVELSGLRGKNTSVIRQMRLRIEKEQAEFDGSGVRIFAVRSVHLKLLSAMYDRLGTAALKAELGPLVQALRQPGLKFGLRKTYQETFEKLRDGLRQAEAAGTDIHAMLVASFRQLNTEYGLSLQVPDAPAVTRYCLDLDLVEKSHLQYLGMGNLIKLSQPEFADRLARALSSRLRNIYESALTDVELWNKSAAAQIDSQLRERKRNLRRRLEAVERIQNAAGDLDARIDELKSRQLDLDRTTLKLVQLTAGLSQGDADSNEANAAGEPITSAASAELA
ncbi:MAG: dynamin family protein [Pseudomonadota bacterium]